MKLPSFDKARILVVGDVMLDRYWFGDVTRISPEAPVPVLKVSKVEERPGGPPTWRATSPRWVRIAPCCRWLARTRRAIACTGC